MVSLVGIVSSILGEGVRGNEIEGKKKRDNGKDKDNIAI